MLVFSMLDLGRILISDLVVANFFACAFTTRYDSTLLGHALFILKVFLYEISYTGVYLSILPVVIYLLSSILYYTKSLCTVK